MTYTKSEQIVAAVHTLLGPVGTCYRSRVEAFTRNEAPAIVVEPGPTQPPEEISGCKLDWQQAITIAVYTRGAVPDQLASPIIRNVHAALMADRTLGGLAIDIMPGPQDPQLASADQPACWYVLTYQVRFRTSITDLAT